MTDFTRSHKEMVPMASLGDKGRTSHPRRNHQRTRTEGTRKLKVSYFSRRTTALAVDLLSISSNIPEVRSFDQLGRCKNWFFYF